ncbi:MAG: glycosyltransferase family 1 protein [Chroococcidiopsidaceae cyanobacterium CP_BM_RX_35]|nr:glycosyltransferase family 1 protein [Chroococcidiopsidaceae cyanobacterium CP_BM_RX_35]
MVNIAKPKLVFFQWKNIELAHFVHLHRQQQVKCLSEFFDVVVISNDCNYQQICDIYEPDLVLFESGVNYRRCKRLNISNTNTCLQVPKLGLHNGDSWCEARGGFLSDMEHWGVETFFTISVTMAEHTPEVLDKLYVWPNFIDPETFRDYNLPKIIPIMLTGYQTPLYSWRRKVYELIKENYPALICPHLGYTNLLDLRMMHGERYARTINASWFVPTCGTVEKEIVRKHFEIPASKSCLITEHSAAIEAAGFTDMVNCVFVNEDNVLDKLDYLFHNTDELENITRAGYDLVHSKHTFRQRSQIFDWFNLNDNLESMQIIIQTNPFDPLVIKDRSSGDKNVHINSGGLVLKLLQEGDKALFSGRWHEAETIYLECANYIGWMPEPKLRLALCNLYGGKAKSAYHLIEYLINYQIQEYGALDPDPVELTYLIISLLCQGKLNEAIIRANQLPSLHHPELDRIRSAISYLQNAGDDVPKLYSHSTKSRYSVHRLPNRSFADWIDNLCILLKACEQFSLAERLKNLDFSEYQPSEKQAKTFNSVIQISRNHLLSVRINLLKTLNDIFEKLHIPNPKPSLPPISELGYVIRLARVAKIDLLKRQVVNYWKRK